MRGNMFMGDGFFGARNGVAPIPVLGQIRGYGYQMRPAMPGTGYRTSTYASPPRRSYAAQNTPLSRRARPTAQPVSSAPDKSEVGCYFCPGLDGQPTYWMSGAQVDQWNERYNAQCQPVKDKECREKYGQMRAQMMARVQRTGFNAFNMPAAAVAPAMTTATPGGYGSTMMAGLLVENPDFIG